MNDPRTGEFLGALFDGLDGHIEVRPMLDVASGEPRPKMGEPKRHWYAGPDSLAGKLPDLARWGKENRHAMFFGVLPRQKGRGKAVDCLPSRVVWADTDWKAHEGGEEDARGKVARFPIMPTITVRSAHGLHLYWILDEVLEPGELSKLAKLVGKAIGGDAVHNPDRLLRLPGSWNMKDPSQPIRATIESIRKERISPAVLRAAAEKFGPQSGERTDRGEPFKSGLLIRTMTSDGQEEREYTVGELLQYRKEKGIPIDDTVKIACPFQKDSSHGSAFLKELDGGGVFIQCMSKRHTHWTRDGLCQWWLDDPKRAKPAKKRKRKPEAAPQVPAGVDPGCWSSLDMTRQGNVRPSPANVWRILEGDARWRGRVFFNEMDGGLYVDGEPIKDSGLTGLRRWLDEHYGCRPSKSDVADVLVEWAEANSRHPLRSRLEALEWDTESRADQLLSRYFGAEDNVLTREISRRWLISAVARVFQPGCKVDTVLILVGPQGQRKSTAFRLLSLNDDWYADTALSFNRSNDAEEKVRGIWIYELAELSSFRRTEWETVKAFITRQSDRYRPAFARYTVKFKRQGVMVGTTNEAQFMVDSTGSRRFWPVRVGAIDLAGLERDREQLWAEAVAFYRGGERWWLEGNVKTSEGSDWLDPGTGEPIRFDTLLEETSSEFNSTDPWEARIRRWVAQTVAPFTIDEICDKCLGKTSDRLTRLDSMRVSAILSAMGCRRERKMERGVRVRKWNPPPRPE